jgi:hypothetical protein
MDHVNDSFPCYAFKISDTSRPIDDPLGSFLDALVICRVAC